MPIQYHATRPPHLWLLGLTIYNVCMVTCCPELSALADQDFLRIGSVQSLTQGRILTEIDTEFFLEFGPTDSYRRSTFVGMNYCPFCGRVISNGLWNKEKKK
jgi:hypothetical protein